MVSSEWVGELALCFKVQGSSPNQNDTYAQLSRGLNGNNLNLRATFDSGGLSDSTAALPA